MSKTVTARTVCTTQAEVDAAAERGDLIIIDSTWWESSSAELWESSRAELRESSSAVLRESSSAELWGSSRAELRESSSAELWGSSRAELWESSRAVLRESSSAELWGSSSAELWGSSSAELRGSSRAELWGSSSAELWGSSRAELWGSSRAELRESSSAELWGSSSAELRGRFAGARLIGPDATADGTGQIYRIDTPAAMADYCGLDIDDGHITLYKAVSKDGTGGGGHHPIRYEIETEAVAPDWDPDPSIECGVGLHLSPSITQARDHNRQAVQVLACRVALVDIAVYELSLAKVRCRAVTPYEVVWTADEQKEDER